MNTDEESFSDSTTVDTPPPERIVLEEEEIEHNQEQPKSVNFVSRVSSIPIIQDITSRTSLGRFAISTANSTLSTVNKYQPKYVKSYYEQYIQPHIEKADELGCRSLDLIQKKYPVVNQPTSEIIQNVTTPSYQIIDRKIAPVVDSFEYVIEKYLPTTTSKEANKRDAQETNQAVRAYYLLNDATLRLSERIPRTREEIISPTRLSETSQYVQKNIQYLQQQIVSYIPSDTTATVNEKLNAISQQASTQLILVLNYIQKQSNDSPEWLKTRVASLLDIANKQIDIIRTQYAREDIQALEKAKQIAQAIQAQIVPILQNIQSQLIYYSDIARQKAAEDLKTPFEYLGFHPKLTTTQ